MSQAKFIKTAMLPKDYPVLRDKKGHILPEIAVAGRSNVGKSSLLNHLFKAHHLVKTSSTPGKTQALNFFTFEDRWAFADLPGYGYAKVSQGVRKQWGPMVQTYLEKRESLKVVLFLLDIRRLPNEDDFQFLDWIVAQNKAMILVLTKIDKVKVQERKQNTAKILEGFGIGNIHYIYYSVPRQHGRPELLAMIRDALQDESETENESEFEAQSVEGLDLSQEEL